HRRLDRRRPHRRRPPSPDVDHIVVIKKRDEVKFDLWHNGFIRGYTTWYAHGETKCRQVEIGEYSEPIEEDNVVGCTQMILDIHNATYLHPDTQKEQALNSFAKQYYEMLEGGRNNVPNLVLTYFPIAPRLQRMYMSQKMSKEMTWHHDHKTDSNKMVHPRNGKAWKHFDSTHPMFSKEIRNPLIKELKTLWNDGGETYDAYRKNNFNMKDTLLWTVSDFPTYAMLSGWSTHDCSFYSFKSHDCHMFMQRLLSIALRGMISNVKLQKSIAETICNLEKIFPPGFFDSMGNLVVHLVWEALLGGPVQHRWMYLYERLFDNYIMQEDPYIDEETLDRARDEKFAQLFKEHSTTTNAEVVDGNVDVEEFFQENKMPTYLNTTDANENTEIEEVGDLDVGDAYMEVSENEEEFVDTYDNLEVNEAEKGFIDTYADSYDENELTLSDHSYDKDEVNLSYHSLNDYLLNIINWTRYAGIMARDYNSKGRGRGRGRGRSGNIGIVGTSSASDYGRRSTGKGKGISGNIVIGGSSNVFGFDNQKDANYDNGSRSGGRGSGISGNIGIGGSSSNVSGFGNKKDANYDNGSKSRARVRGISGNIVIGGSSNVSGFGNQEDANYDNGSRSGERGRGTSGNIGIGSSSNVSEFVDQDVDYDDGRSGGRGRGRSENIGDHGSSNVSEFGNQEDANYDNVSRNRGMDSYDEPIGDIEDNLSPQSTLQVLSSFEVYTSPMTNPKEVEETTGILMEDLYQWHPSENAAVYKALERVMSSSVSSEASGSGMDATSKGRTREYITTSSKRVVDVVEAAIVKKHEPDASDHPPNDFDLWEKATGGRRMEN
nr:hypothetical protein [Tanacetum cinerariifolium]